MGGVMMKIGRPKSRVGRDEPQLCLDGLAPMITLREARQHHDNLPYSVRPEGRDLYLLIL